MKQGKCLWNVPLQPSLASPPLPPASPFCRSLRKPKGGTTGTSLADAEGACAVFSVYSVASFV